MTPLKYEIGAGFDIWCRSDESLALHMDRVRFRLKSSSSMLLLHMPASGSLILITKVASGPISFTGKSWEASNCDDWAERIWFRGRISRLAADADGRRWSNKH